MPTNKEEREAGWVSVTEVLDAFIPKGLLDWYLRTGKKEAKRLGTIAMKIGSRVDELIQQDVAGGYKLSSKDPIEVKNCIEAWESFKRDYCPVVKATQVRLVDGFSKVVGNADIVTDNTIIDVKCSTSIRDNYWLQVAKYYEMLDVDMFPTVCKTAILRLDKNLGTYEYKIGKNVSQCQRVFDGLLEAYRFYNAPKEQEETCQTS